MDRLNAETLSRLEGRPGVTVPPAGWADQQVGIVHMGIGAFHRAHQAVFTSDAFALTKDPRWGICGVTQRSASVRDQLAPQDGLYGVLERAVDYTGVKVVGSVREVLFPAEDGAILMDRIAAPTTMIVSLTVTEKGYRRGGDGHLDLNDPLVAADLKGDALPQSAVGRLVRGLEKRANAGGEKITVLCCDNLTNNGNVLNRLVNDFCDAADLANLKTWIGANVTFPCTMVDRIVPATTDADRELAAEILGLQDNGLVTGELFKQWVIENKFANEHPAWDQVGAQFVTNVEPFENMKLRILNGSHSTLAYLGALRGYPTIVKSVTDPELNAIARGLIFEDVIPILEQPEGEDLQAYGEMVLKRYSNPALAHKTTQIAMDGSQKLPLRLLGTIRANLAQGKTAHYAMQGVAGWMAYVASTEGKDGLALPVEDPMADRLTGLVRGTKDAPKVVDSLLGVTEIFGEDLPNAPGFREELVEDVTGLLQA